MSKTGPVGPAWPIDEELRHAFQLRLKELGWGHEEFAARVSEIRRARGEKGITRTAISHVLNRAVQSGMIPDMERAVGWDPNRRFRGNSTLAQGTSGGAGGAQVDVDVVRDFLQSPDQIELVTGYQRLNVGNRASVLERVRVLLEVQAQEHQRPKTRRQTD
jgi:hypothetical protein